MDMPFQAFLRPEIGFIFALVLLVIGAGIFLSRSELTGRRVLAVVVSFFAVIIAVNFVLANRAVSTFPGLEVKNSYVASQSFDRERAAQTALGWTLAPEYDDAAKELRLTFTDAEGLPAPVSSLKVLVGRTTEANEDRNPDFGRRAGVHVASADLAPGKWMLQIEAQDPNGTLFRQRIDLFVKG